MGNKQILGSVLVAGLLIVGAIYYSGGSSNLSGLSTAKLAEIPDSFYQALVVSGGVAKNLEGISFSPDGKQVAYIVKQSGKSAVYLNDAEGSWYDTVNLSPFAFSSDSKHYVYIASKAGDSFAVVDGIEQEHHSEGYIDSSSVLIGSSGAPAYTVVVSGTSGGNLSEYAVFNGHSGDTYRFVEFLKISPDGQSASYYGCKPDFVPSDGGYDNALTRGTGFCTFVIQDLDGTTHKPDGVFYSSGISSAIYHLDDIYSPDGKLLAYTTRLGETDSFTINGVRTFSPPGDYSEKNISGIVFSPDSKHTAYLVQGCDANNVCPSTSFGQPVGGKWYTVLDNVTVGTEYDQIENLTFDSQGQLAYFARIGDQWSLIDGANTYPVPDDLKFPSQIMFSRDNSYLYTYNGADKQVHLVSNGNEVAKADFIEFPAFTPSGKIIYTAIPTDAKSMSIFIDGTEFKHDVVEPFVSLPTSIYGPYYTFTPDGKVLYGAIDGNQIYRVVDSI